MGEPQLQNFCRVSKLKCHKMGTSVKPPKRSEEQITIRTFKPSRMLLFEICNLLNIQMYSEEFAPHGVDSRVGQKVLVSFNLKR